MKLKEQLEHFTVQRIPPSHPNNDHQISHEIIWTGSIFLHTHPQVLY